MRRIQEFKDYRKILEEKKCELESGKTENKDDILVSLEQNIKSLDLASIIKSVFEYYSADSVSSMFLSDKNIVILLDSQNSLLKSTKVLDGECALFFYSAKSNVIYKHL